jgi:hypothetical protein
LKPPINRKLVSADHVVRGNRDAREVGQNVVKVLAGGNSEKRLEYGSRPSSIYLSDLNLPFSVAFVLKIVYVGHAQNAFIGYRAVPGANRGGSFVVGFQLATSSIFSSAAVGTSHRRPTLTVGI